MKIELLKPYLLILLPIFYLFLVGSVVWFRLKFKKNTKRSLVFHGIAGTLLILSLCGLGIKWTSKSITTLYVADLSDSAKFYQENIQDFIEESIKKLPKDQYAGIITFGGDTKLEQFVSEKKVFSKFQAYPTRTSTNLEDAISVALSLLNEDTAKRIVLLTDGYENSGSIENIAASVLANHVDFKVVQIEKNQVSEVYVNNLEIPEKINIGDQFSVKIDVMSNKATTAVIHLYSGRTLKAQEHVQLQSGSNQFVFKDTQTEGGLKIYRVVIDAVDDTETVNNEYSAYTTIRTAPQILVVEGQSGIAEEFEKVLQGSNINYKKVTPSGTPESMDQMLEYKSIVFVDVHYDDLKSGFTSSLESYVKDYAGGFVAIGGQNSFALGNYKDTPVETVLPVYMDLKGEKEIPPIAFVLVIDQSGSMSDGNGYTTNLDLAKEAAIKALDNLREIDSIGVLSFSDSYSWAAKVRKATNYEEVQNSILGITLGGGTSIYPAIGEAVVALKGNDSRLKHIILLTDGQDGFRDYNDLLQEMNDSGITLSTVSIGTDADTPMLEQLAKEGKGRYYHTDINTNIPRIFAQEVFLSVKSYLVNREFVPIVAGNHDLITSVASEGLPLMYGYVASSKKEFAQTLLLSDSDDPILTIWQYGLGKTVAFNSDVENRWTGNYAGWGNYPLFWKNIIDYTISDVEGNGIYATVEAKGDSALITYTTEESDSNTGVTAIYTYEDGSSSEVTLYPTAPGVYNGEFQTNEAGVYSINIRQQNGEEIVSNLNTAYVMQYSREYRFAEDTKALSRFVSMVQGRFIEEPEQVYEGQIETVKARLSLTIFFLIAALFIFMADVILRRLNIKLEVSGKVLETIGSWKNQIKDEQKERKSKGKGNPIPVATLKKSVDKSNNFRMDSNKRAEKVQSPDITENRKTKAKDPVEEKPKTSTRSSSGGILDTNELLKRKQKRDERE